MEMVKSYVEVNVVEVGEEAALMFEEGMMILFNDTVPADLKGIAVVHDGRDFSGELQVGDHMVVDGESFEILFVGSKANETLKELGHATFNFDGETHSDMPGTVCLEKKPIPEMHENTTISFQRR
ncbi:PTS system, glucitol/sorbitol-specific IIA component [Oceanobacillus limi]|uniref:PTS system, glucitol/sorbitol-specific IIA component n=1 Tax=Oceanobacillus limi TaxID=930131 RepID=A0A1I0AFT3_9BACI|nr:PTS glucitol/sorbitol transporter subunit IIA [Oceanobacillus limi]SES92108.1 PTS system, glucitol/sorbitol-specific IIA component [Oceanobacillus limi]